ncbi:hypothetical protein GLOIN_2v741902 [Rhizophagus clarus]|uniref:Uncharacterized protein n=1 Tax=Rhizophagus clarus TaxID=94130 RepID=A0A8H3M9T5_9GLOM|nr:hypothetical protein GLOIN_2v741902 [Rhizophagus clarus]
MSTTPVNQSKKLIDPQQNRQFEMVPEKAEKSQTPETKSIVKPTGNYTNIAKVLKLNNEEFNGYKSNIRDIVEASLERFKMSNNLFPKSTGDWAIKELIRRSINNKRAHQKNKRRKRKFLQKRIKW